MSDTLITDLPETDELELTGLRAEDSLLFRTQPSSGMIALASLAEDFFAHQIHPEPSGVDVLAATDAGDATPLLLPVRAPASARPSPRLVGMLSAVAMILGLATAGLAFAVARAPQPAAASEPVAVTRPEALPVPRPLDTAPPILVPLPTVAIAEPVAEPEPEPVVAPPPAPEVTIRKPATRKPAPAKPRPVVSKPAVTADKPCADEIECLLAGIDTSPPPPRVADPAPEVELPDSLDTLAISQVMKKAQSKAASCDDRFGGGNVKIKVSVGSDGKVTSASVVSAGSPELGACVIDATRAQRFPRTHTGATFQWLFPYR